MKIKFWKKMWKKNVGKNFFFLISKKKFWKNNFEKKIFQKSCDKKNFGKINSKTKIFVTKLYSNIDKCHAIFALLAPFDKTGRKTGSNENVCGIWFKIGSVALALDARNAAIWTKSEENIYHGLRAVGNQDLLCNKKNGCPNGVPKIWRSTLLQ